MVPYKRQLLNYDMNYTDHGNEETQIQLHRKGNYSEMSRSSARIVCTREIHCSAKNVSSDRPIDGRILFLGTILLPASSGDIQSTTWRLLPSGGGWMDEWTVEPRRIN